VPACEKFTCVVAAFEFAMFADAGPEYSFHKIAAVPLGSTIVPVSVVLSVLTFWSAPALTVGAPCERGPSFGPVVWITSKLLTSIEERLLNAFDENRSSGQTEMEKKPPLLSATIAPYFFSA
jgi:hypothetical protein